MLQLFNSLTQQKENFVSIKEEEVSLYVCGITPYDTTHLGHAFTYITFDALVRFLAYKGYKVNYTQNVTDINDRDNDLLKKAKEQNVSWQNLAAFWTEKFLMDMAILNWVPPTHYLWASQQIEPMIMLIQKIILNEVGYEIRGSVYLDIEKIGDFGKLSKLTPEQMLERAREFEEDIDNPDKKHPLDITLWRASSPNQPMHIPSFDSPWGKGRPGWHIECSAMATSSLGEQIDIHGGGIDLIYPHHESEIAQSESATGKKPFAKFWMHNGPVSLKGEKMSKSKGNLILVNDLLKKYSADTIRWVLLSHHYRSFWNFEEKDFEQAEQMLSLLKNKLVDDLPDADQEVISSLENDLDTPKALNILSLSPSKKMLSMLGFSLQS